MPADLWIRARAALTRGQLPNALVIGASKGGTTSLHDWLSRHPAICTSRVKEVRYFSSHYDKSLDWYAAHFAPKRGETVRLESSPNYLWDANVPRRVRERLGTPKLIVLLREPIDRAYSQYAMRLRLGMVEGSFEEVLAREEARFGAAGQMPEDGSVHFLDYARYSYLGKSLYAPQVERWLSVFPLESFMFIRSEDVFAHPAAVMDALLRFLDVPAFSFPHLPARNVGTYQPVGKEMRCTLQPLFEASNGRIEVLTGIHWRNA